MGWVSWLLGRLFGPQETPSYRGGRPVLDAPDFDGPSEPPPRDENRADLVNISGSGNFDFEVVGESRYQKNLERICGGKTPEGHNLEIIAVLVLEDDNPHDPKAVRVDIGKRTVGYLPRETARKYRKQLAKAGHPTLNATCWAIIRGGWDRGDGDEGFFGVVVDLPGRG